MEDREVQGLEVQIEASVNNASFDRAERRIEELSRDVNVNVGARSFFSRASNISRDARQFSARVSRGFMGYMSSMSDGFFGYLRRNRRNTPYANSPFRKLVSNLGSTMLLTYAAGMATRGAMSAMTTVADTEVESLKGRAYRDSLSDPTSFDKATNRLSDLTGQARFQSRARLATLYDKLNRNDVSTSSFSPDQIVETLRGMQIASGETPEQVDKKLIELLTGRGSEEDKKEYGVVSRDNPTKILKEIHKTLKENSIASLAMDRSLLQDDMQAIINAPKKMLENIRIADNGIFEGAIDVIRKNVEGFWGNGNEETSGRWIVFANTVSKTLESVLGDNLGRNIANIIVDEVGRSVADVKYVSDAIRKLDENTSGKLGEVTGYLSRIALRLGIGAAAAGTAINLGNILWKYSGLKTAFEITGVSGLARFGWEGIKSLPGAIYELPKTYWEASKGMLRYGKDFISNIGFFARLTGSNVATTGRAVIGGAAASAGAVGAGITTAIASNPVGWGIAAAAVLTAAAGGIYYYNKNKNDAEQEYKFEKKYELTQTNSIGMDNIYPQPYKSSFQQNNGNTVIHANNIYMDKDGMDIDTMMNGGGL